MGQEGVKDEPAAALGVSGPDRTYPQVGGPMNSPAAADLDTTRLRREPRPWPWGNTWVSAVADVPRRVSPRMEPVVPRTCPWGSTGQGGRPVQKPSGREPNTVALALVRELCLRHSLDRRFVLLGGQGETRTGGAEK